MYSKIKNQKGFVLTLDAIVALLIVVAFLFIIQVQPYETEPYIAKLSINERTADLFIALDENGFLTSTMDEEIDADEKMEIIYDRLRGTIPANMDFRIDLMRYDANELKCRIEPHFDGCFTEMNIYPAWGDAVPTDKDIISGSATFMRGQPPGQCEILPIELAGEEDIYVPENEKLLFSSASENEKLSFSSAPETLFFAEGDLDFFFYVDVTPSDELECDEDLRVDLRLEVYADDGRAPIDMMLVLDRTASMGDCVIADGTVIISETKTTTLDWELAGTIDLAEADAFDVLIEWTDECALDTRPKMYLVHPDTGAHYGFGHTAPNIYDCFDDAVNYYEEDSFSYLALPSVISEIGDWEIYVKKNNPNPVSYDLTIKEITAPLSKLQSMKNESVKFIYNAEWQPDDQIGYVSFANKANKESPLPSNRGAVQI